MKVGSLVSGMMVLAGVLGSVACGAPVAPEEGPAMCALRQGTYLVHWSETSGDCGGHGDEIATFAQTAESVGATREAEAPCTEGWTDNADDNCSTTVVRYTCPLVIESSGSSIYDGKIDWAPDGASGKGLYEIEMRDSQGLLTCRSVYELTYAKL